MKKIEGARLGIRGSTVEIRSPGERSYSLHSLKVKKKLIGGGFVHLKNDSFTDIDPYFVASTHKLLIDQSQKFKNPDMLDLDKIIKTSIT